MSQSNRTVDGHRREVVRTGGLPDPRPRRCRGCDLPGVLTLDGPCEDCLACQATLILARHQLGKLRRVAS
jgi:hypothetical protein